MKLKLIAVISIVLVLFSCEKKERSINSQSIVFFDELISLFVDPPAEYRSAPLWVWNKDVSTEDIDRSLRAFKEVGIGGAFIHPRPGLITEYLSDKWFDLVKYSRDLAKELEMKLWIYDENSYPSGFAGGFVQHQMPESYNQGNALIPREMSTLSLEENQFVKYVFKKVNGNWQDITASASQENGSRGQYMVFILRDVRQRNAYYVDLLVKGVTEKFIDITFTGYKNNVGEDFGKTIPGTFSDEPHVLCFFQNSFAGTGQGIIRWSPDLPLCFKELFGYDLESNVISLLEETGNWKKIRHDYYATILDMFINRWSKPMSQYCRNNNLIFTGHYWEHGWPSPALGPDNMAMYAFHTQPGIDMLYNSQEERPDQFGNVRSVKEISSVANQFGRKRTLSETYGGSGWELRFDEMKRNGDWEYTLGVNFLNQHHAFISLMGDRKHDYPPSFGPFAPYWKQYRYQADYFARLSVALSSGSQKNRILILEPTTTAWMYYSPQTVKINKRFDEINPSFRKLLDLLEQSRVEYDLGCENIIRDHGKVRGKKFLINQGAYDIVIIPDVMDNINRSTYELLKKYITNGGKVIQFGEGVKYIDAEPSDELINLTTYENWIKKEEVSSEVINEFLLDPDFSVRYTKADGKLYHMRRQMEDGQLLFFSNFSLDNNSGAEVSLKGASVEGLSPESGRTFPVAYTKTGDKVTFPIDLYPCGSYLVYVHRDKIVEPDITKETTRILSEGSETTISCSGPNILNQDYLKLKIGDGPEKDMYFAYASDSVYRHFGFAGANPWRRQQRIADFWATLDKDKEYKKGDRFEAVYNFEIIGNIDLTGIEMIVERPWLYTVSLNGTVIESEKGESWLDPDFLIFKVEKQLKKGKNEVRLAADPFSVHCEIEPVYLLGNFGLESSAHGWKIVAPKPLKFGSWKELGMPFYGQSVKYSKTVPVKKPGKYEIELTNWSGTVAAVNINGQEKGIIQAEPYVFKTELQQGENIIDIIVIGSLKNTLGPHHGEVPHGVGGRPDNFRRNAPRVQPEGNLYSVIDYGLMEDFKVYEIR